MHIRNIKIVGIEEEEELEEEEMYLPIYQQYSI